MQFDVESNKESIKSISVKGRWFKKLHLSRTQARHYFIPE